LAKLAIREERFYIFPHPYLLELARPWWETWPERFQSLVQRLGKLEVAYGHAMAELRQAGHLVPTLIFRTAEEFETSARVLYISLRDGQLRLRFQLGTEPVHYAHIYEVTFVSNTNALPLFSAQAPCSVDSEYYLTAELPEDLLKDCEHLKVTDAMPFRMILRPVENGS
jgi:hypothetical protein